MSRVVDPSLVSWTIDKKSKSKIKKRVVGMEVIKSGVIDTDNKGINTGGHEL